MPPHPLSVTTLAWRPHRQPGKPADIRICG